MERVQPVINSYVADRQTREFAGVAEALVRNVDFAWNAVSLHLVATIRGMKARQNEHFSGASCTEPEDAVSALLAKSW